MSLLPTPRMLFASCLTFALLACTSAKPEGEIVIKTLSNRADLISGGNALVELQLPAGVEISRLRVSLNGREVGELFAEREDGRILGLVEGLGEGSNELVAEASGLAARLQITNHPKGGPVFSGPQIQPWVCATPEAQKGDANTPETSASGLTGEALDEQCNIASEVKHFYRTTERCGRNPENPREVIPCFKPYDSQGVEPSNIARIRTASGEEIPFIVRVERGTLNRGIYDIAVIEKSGVEWSPFIDEGTWNGKLVHYFGGSTGTPRRQFPPNSSWMQEDVLAKGYMVSVSSLTDQALNANKVVAAETLLMLKEHIGDSYGEITSTIGFGCSGGSIMQLVIAGTYPGILDGIQPSCTYPDSHTTSMEVTDCVLLENYFASEEFAVLTKDLSESEINRKRAAIAGHENQKACGAWNRSFGHSNNPGNFERAGRDTNNCRLPSSWVFDAETNPGGVRCSQPDHEINLWGKSPEGNFARRYADNVGIQYGLGALEEGSISVEEFISLNANIGGSDIDKGITKERMRGEAEAIALAYRMGMVTDPRQWAKTPIIDLRGSDNSGIHMNWRAWAVRDRLDRVLGSHDNQVIWRFGPGLLPPAESNLLPESLATMDAWVSAIKADTSNASQEQKVVNNKPENAFDFCYIGDDFSNKITDKAKCDADPVLAYYQSPRQIAGGPQAENILKCSLKALNRDDYGVTFSDEQWQRMQTIFPEGVCDWSKPGVGMQAAVPWLDYSAGPGGEAMPAAPVSRPL